MRTTFKEFTALLLAFVLIIGTMTLTLSASTAYEPSQELPPGVPIPVWNMADEIYDMADGSTFTQAGPLKNGGDATLTVRHNVVINEVHGWADLARTVTAVEVTRPAATDGLVLCPEYLGLEPGEIYIWEITGQRTGANHRAAFGTVNSAGVTTMNGAAVTPAPNNHPTRPGFFSLRRTITHTDAIEAYRFYGVAATGANPAAAAGDFVVYEITVQRANSFVLFQTDFSDGTTGIVTGGHSAGFSGIVPDTQDPTNNVFRAEIPPGIGGNWWGFNIDGGDLQGPTGATYRATFVVRRAAGPAVNARLRLATQTGGVVSNWDIAGHSQQLGTDWTTYTIQPFALEPGVGVAAFQLIRNSETWSGTMELDSVIIEVIEAPAEEVVGRWEPNDTLPSLAQRYSGFFTIGNILDSVPSGQLAEMFVYQYNSITAENAMKPVSLSPARGVFTFDHADAFVDWALSHDIEVIGHALLWHSQSARWLTNNDDGTPATRADARANLEKFITEVAGHFSGRVAAWDVANEVFTNNGGSGAWHANMRTNSPWWIAYNNGRDAAAGEQPWDFVYDAFVFARLADPYTTLIYNDFNCNSLPKARNMRDMTNELNAKWATDTDNNYQAGDFTGTHVEIVEAYLAAGGRLLIETLGLQSHHNAGTLINHPNPEQNWVVRNALEIYAQIPGITLAITELDITNHAGFAYDPVHQENQYRELFELLLEFSDIIDRVTFWGTNDVQSWRGPQNPTLFARPTSYNPYFRAKPAFHTVAALPPTQQPQTGVIYSLAEDALFQALDRGPVTNSDFYANPWLAVSGGPTLTIIENPSNPDKHSILVENRAQAFYAVDVLFAHAMIPNGTYSISVSGRLAAPHTANRTMQIARPDANWSAFANSNVTIPAGQVNWTINHTFTREVLVNDFFSGAQPGARIRAGGTGAAQLQWGFIIDSIEVIRLTVGDGVFTPPGFDLNERSLAGTFADRFYVGNIWSTNARMNLHNTQQGFMHHYNAVTAENAHKVDHVLAAAANAWNFTWGTADYIVNWAEANDLAMVGHTLAWHSQSRPWLTHTVVGGQAIPVTRAQAIYNMRRFISTVAGRYSGRMYSWDVLNEAIRSWMPYYGEDGWAANPDWRAHLRVPTNTQTRWYHAFANGADEAAGECGTDFIYYAFKFARMYDPFAILYYNDYNEDAPGKREAIAHMIEDLNNRWAHDLINNHEAVPEGEEYTGRLLIEAMGMQSHYHIRGWTTSLENIEAAIQRYIGLGLRVSITELDITIWGQGTTGTIEENGYTVEQLLGYQAERYAALFRLYMQYADDIGRVTFWGKADNQSWRASGLPLLFDALLHTKSAFHAVMDAFDDVGPATNISRPVVTNTAMHSDAVARPGLNFVTEPDEPFAVQFLASQNNNAPLLWSVEGNLPPGLRMIARTGAIIGTPEVEGVFHFNVIAENTLYSSEPVQVTITVGEPPQQNMVIWSLQTCETIQALEHGEVTGFGAGVPLVRAGPPIMTIVENPADTSLNAVQLSGRSANWHGVDILFSNLLGRGMRPDIHEYTLTIIARRLTPETGNVQLQIARNEGPWDSFAMSNTTTAAGETFTIEWLVDADLIGGSNIRIQSPNTTMSFVIDEIKVVRTGEYVGLPVISLYPNGQPGVTSTEIEIRLSHAHQGPALTLGNVTLDAGLTGAVATSLTRVSDTVYTLAVSGVNTMGRVIVSIDSPYVSDRSASAVLFHSSITEVPLGPTVLRDLNSPTGYTVQFVLENHTASVVALQGELMMQHYTNRPPFNVANPMVPYTPHEFRPGLFPSRAAGVYSQRMVEIGEGLFFAELPLPGGAMKYWHLVDGVRLPDAHNMPHLSNYHRPRLNINQAYSVIFVPFDAERQDPRNNRDIERPRDNPAERGQVVSVRFDSDFPVVQTPNSHPGMLPYVGDAFGCLLIYLPPGHDPNRAEPYPVIYLSHGHWDGHIDWINGGAVPEIMDNLIYLGYIEPAIVVSINNSRHNLGFVTANARLDLFNSIMPTVEYLFNASSNANQRAVAGYSMGGSFANNILMNNAHDVHYFGFFSGGGTGTALANAVGGEYTTIVAGGGYFQNYAFLNTIENYAPGVVGVYRVPGGHDLHAWAQLFTIMARDYLWTPQELQLPVFSFDIFNNGEGGSPSRPNPGLAAAGIIRMWTQLDGVNTPVYLAAADTIEALDQDGECAEDFVRVGRVWQDGTGWLNYF
ncbi:MAG: endo-1,4-beta-xylanase, partial [Firmicutes bacterium]|nr:endo-1,4-beta-xylanase [Bacillota bacterium]